MRAILVVLAATAIAAGSATPSVAATRCAVKHNFTAKGFTYSVTVRKGDITCGDASRVLKAFVKRQRSSAFSCFRTHSDNPYKPVAKCADERSLFTATLVAG